MPPDPPPGTFTAFCQACGAIYTAGPRAVGKRARCLACGHQFRVPNLVPRPAEEPPGDGSQAAGGSPASSPSPPAVVPQEPHRLSLDAVEPRAPRPARRPAVAPPATPTDAPSAPYDMAEPAPDGPVDLLGSDDLQGLAGAEGPLDDAIIRSPRQSEAPLEDAVRDESHPVERPDAPNGAVLVMVGILYLGFAAVVLILMFNFLGPLLSSWLLLPIVAVYGRKLGSHLIYLTTAGTVAAR